MADSIRRSRHPREFYRGQGACPRTGFWQSVRVFEIQIPAHCHDAYFKSVFSVPERAAAFFRRYLPAAVAESVD